MTGTFSMIEETADGTFEEVASGSTTLPSDSGERKNIPIYRGVIRYFPAALAAAARVSKFGNDKHNPGEELHHARGKSMDHADCIIRHLIDLDEDFGRGKGFDENGMPQVGYIVWRALALAQEWLEREQGAPLAPGAKLPADKPSYPTIEEVRAAFQEIASTYDVAGEELRHRTRLYGDKP